MHIISSTNNEKIFFADKVLMVEGITDYLVFQRIIEKLASKKNETRVVEIIEIKGKTNRDKFSSFLSSIGVDSYFIADLDYVHNIGDKTLKTLFVHNTKKIEADVLKNPKSRDYASLVETLDSSIGSADLAKLSELWDYIKGQRVKMKSPLTSTESALLDSFIKKKRRDGIYILSRGDIEDYFPVEFRSKDLDNVFRLLEESNVSSWSSSNEYKELETIAKKILR